MKKAIIVVLVMLSVLGLFGVKVVLTYGEVVEGEIKGKSSDKIYVYLENEDLFVSVDIEYIASILDNENNDITEEVYRMKNFNIYSDAKQKTGQESSLHTAKPKQEHRRYETEIKIEMLALTATLLYFAIDNFVEVSDINNEIKKIEKIEQNNHNLEPDTSKLKSQRNRKTVGGIICGISSIITITHCTERVEIQASPTSLSLSYKF